MRCCETCGKPLVRNVNHSNAQWERKRFCERQCAAQRLVKERACACGCGERTLPGRKWIKGHRPLKLRNGYVFIWKPGHPMAHKNGKAAEHRVVAYEAGLLTDPKQQVHHRNGIKHDNRLENLEVMAIGEHTRLHAKERAPAHCPAGHAYTPENTAYVPQGWRYCKVCNRLKVRAAHARKRAALHVSRVGVVEAVTA